MESDKKTGMGSLRPSWQRLKGWRWTKTLIRLSVLAAVVWLGWLGWGWFFGGEKTPKTVSSKSPSPINIGELLASNGPGGKMMFLYGETFSPVYTFLTVTELLQVAGEGLGEIPTNHSVLTVALQGVDPGTNASTKGTREEVLHFIMEWGNKLHSLAPRTLPSGATTSDQGTRSLPSPPPVSSWVERAKDAVVSWKKSWRETWGNMRERSLATMAKKPEQKLAPEMEPQQPREPAVERNTLEPPAFSRETVERPRKRTWFGRMFQSAQSYGYEPNTYRGYTTVTETPGSVRWSYLHTASVQPYRTVPREIIHVYPPGYQSAHLGFYAGGRFNPNSDLERRKRELAPVRYTVQQPVMLGAGW